MKWVYLLLSITLEVIGTTLLKLASEPSAYRTGYAVGTAVCYLLCFAFLGGAMRQFSLSVVYATWSGVGVGLLAVIGVVFFKDPINPLKIVSFLLVIAGIIGLNMSGMTH